MEKEKPLQCVPRNPNPIAPRRSDLDCQFTELELVVAEQLVHLSERSRSTASANPMASASCSTRFPLDNVVDDDEGFWRRNKGYRLISDVYASTVPIGGEGGGKKEIRNRKG